MTWMHETEFQVRDYELDIQGIVNNANYLHYFEHARHLFLRTIGLDFADLHDRGIDAVVARIEVDYLSSLRSGDAFLVRTAVEQKGRLRFIFRQEIARASDGEICARALITSATLKEGRPVPCPEISEALEKVGDRAMEKGKAD
jgi:acyl-CoA thioester hydrolase